MTSMPSAPSTQGTASTPAPRAGRKEWIGLAVLVLPCLLTSMDMSVLLFGLPFISASLIFDHRP